MIDRDTAYILADGLIADAETDLTIEGVRAMSDTDLTDWLGSFGYFWDERLKCWGLRMTFDQVTKIQQSGYAAVPGNARMGRVQMEQARRSEKGNQRGVMSHEQMVLFK